MIVLTANRDHNGIELFSEEIFKNGRQHDQRLIKLQCAGKVFIKRVVPIFHPISPG